MLKKIITAPLLWVVIIFALLLSLLIITSEEPPKTPDIDSKKRVSADVIELGSYIPEVLLFGQVDSPNLITFRAPISGYIKSVYVESGSKVRSGQALMIMDMDDIDLQRQSAEAQLSSLQTMLNKEVANAQNNRLALNSEKKQLEIAKENEYRFKTLYEKGLGARLDYQQAQQSVLQLQVGVNSRKTLVDSHKDNVANIQSQVEQAQTALDQIELNIERSRVTADQDLLLGDVYVSEGELVSAGQPLASGFNEGDLEIVTKVPAAYQQNISQSLLKGQPVLAKTDAGGKPLALELARLGNQVTGAGTVNAYFTVKGEAPLKLGMQQSVLLSMPAVENSVVLPVSAIHSGNRVYLIEDNKLKGIYVDVVGELTDAQGIKQQIVTSDEFANGQTVMVTQMTDAAEGMLVETAMKEKVMTQSSMATEG